MDQKIESLKAKKTRYAEKRAALSEQFTALAAQSTGPSRKKLEERELSSDVQITNRRRVTRQAVHISTNLVQVGGSIAASLRDAGSNSEGLILLFVNRPLIAGGRVARSCGQALKSPWSIAGVGAKVAAEFAAGSWRVIVS